MKFNPDSAVPENYSRWIMKTSGRTYVILEKRLAAEFIRFLR